LEEKGQRATRSTDVYVSQKGAAKEGTVCRKCGASYRNRHWTMEPEEVREGVSEPVAGTVICPACQRMADDNPAGIVTLQGDYLLEHEDEILNILKHTEARSRQKNPLARIMEIRQDADVITIATTEDKLAQKLGREVYKAHRGELHYQWSHENRLVRVAWNR